MHPPPPTPPDTLAYRDLNRTLMLLILIVIAWAFVMHTVTLILGHPLMPCASQAWLGIPCPLCGMTRGAIALMHGDLPRTITLNPLTPAAALLAVAELLYRAAGATRQGATILLPFRPTDRLLHLTLAIAFFAYALFFYF